jgi:folate-dependent phosphoribosylglycinamide formyltransferase PurN
VRVVILCSSPYSETGCAMAARLAQLGHAPVGALTLPTLDRGTLLRKVAQWGLGESARYAWTKLATPKTAAQSRIRNPYLETFLRHDHKVLRNLHEVATACHFPVVTCSDQNSPEAIAQVREWSPDVAVFTGGNILRRELLAVPRLGVVNSHLALLPKIRGMSSPEWSLLCDVPLGVTIHSMDIGIDTGPVLLQRPFSDAQQCESFSDMRNRMIAFGIEIVGEALAGLEAGTLTPTPQLEVDQDHQYFVMHDWLKAQAWSRLKSGHVVAASKAGE